MAENPLQVSVSDAGVARVLLNRPEVHNAFDDSLIGDLDRAFADLAANPAVRVVVLTGAGKSFSAGADLNWMKRTAGYSVAENRADARRLAELLLRIARLARPTIARVQGPAYGGGLGLVSACDIAIASDRAAFMLSEVRLGLIPAVISPYVVAAIGARAARRYAITAERMDAETARALGLVHEVVPEADLDAAVDRIIAELFKGAPGAIASAKELIDAVALRPIDQAVAEDTARRIADARAGDEGREGVAAFLERRRPRWQGD